MIPLPMGGIVPWQPFHVNPIRPLPPAGIWLASEQKRRFAVSVHLPRTRVNGPCAMGSTILPPMRISVQDVLPKRRRAAL